MSRLPDWRSRLDAYIDRTRDRAFSHSNYCGLWTADAVLAMTGVDHAAGFRACRTRAAALKAIHREGYIDHVDMARGLYPEIPVSMAAEGDIAVVPMGKVPALGIVQGAQIYLVGEKRLMLVDLLLATTAFRVA